MAERLKCANCGKRFKQANRKQVLCADCLAKERQAKKNALPTATTGHGAGSPSERVAAIPIVQIAPPPEVAVFGSRAREAERHVHAPERVATVPSTSVNAPAQQPREQVARPTAPATHDAPSKQARQPTKSAAPQHEKHTRPPRPAPFELTGEMRANIERRYLELAQPVEFDGIRTQIAGELNVPKPVVKQVIQELRVSRQLPSWWELQAYKGSVEELERVRERYLPLLPVPPVGVHKQIASELDMDPPQVYQAIRRVRAEMKLPQYNPPESHGDAAEMADTVPEAPVAEEIRPGG
jgi:hypothetical protein